MIGEAFIYITGIYQRVYKKALDKSERFYAPANIKNVAKSTEPVVSLGSKYSKGYLTL